MACRSIVGDDDHLFGLQVGGRIGLDAVRPGAGPLRDVGGRNSVAPEFRPHGLDPAVENAGALFGVAATSARALTSIRVTVCGASPAAASTTICRP